MVEMARALLLDGDELVLVRQAPPGAAPSWTAPGGAVGPGDASAEAALRRWLHAEWGVLAGPAAHVFTLAEADRTELFFACRLVACDRPELGDRLLRLRPEQAHTVPVAPRALADYLAGQGRAVADLLDAVTYAPRRFRPVVDVSLLLVAEGRVLLGQRRGTGYADGEWQIMPSGHLEQGESVVRAAIREAREELGIEVAGPDVEFAHLLHHRNVGGTARLGVFFRARRWTGVPRIAEPDKCARLSWFPPDAPPERLTPHTAAALAGLRAQGGLSGRNVPHGPGVPDDQGVPGVQDEPDDQVVPGIQDRPGTQDESGDQGGPGSGGGSVSGPGGGFSLSGWHQPPFAELEIEALRAGYAELSVTSGRGRTVVRPGESLAQAVRRAGGAPGRYLRAADYVTPDGRPGRLFHIAQKY